MEKDSVNVKLPVCDTLAFLRLSLVEGFRLAFVQRIQVICWKFYCVIMGIDELLRMSTGYNFWGVWNLPPGWKQGDAFFWWVVCTVILSKMIFHWWMRCCGTGRCSRRSRLFPPCSFPALPWRAALPWCDWCLLKRLEQRKLGFLLFSDLLRVE